MAMYAKWIYPKAEVGQAHKRPMMPMCFVRLHEVTVSWDIHSNNENDRAEYWEVDMVEHAKVCDLMPPLMTEAEVEIDVYGIEGKAAWIAAHPGPTN